MSDLDFAAWLEGRLSETAAARIEAAVAADPEMRRAALELSEVLGMPLPAAPARLEVRAKALVGFEVEQRARRARLVRLAVRQRPALCLPRVATLTAAVVIAISGFMLGGGLGESMAQERYAMTSAIRHVQRADRIPGLGRHLTCRAWFTVALALSLLLNAFFVAGFVFRSWIAPLPFEQRMPPPPPPPGARPSALEVVAGDLNLDAGQRQALRGVFEQHAQPRRERYREMQKVREQIVAEYRRPPLDQARLAPLIDRMGDLRADQQKETVRALAQIEAQLDARAAREDAPDPGRPPAGQPVARASRARRPPPRPSQ